MSNILNKHELQILDIFWNECVNNALEALSKMLNKKVEKTSSLIKIDFLNQLTKILEKDITNTIVYTKMKGPLKCVILLVLPLKNFLRLIDILLHKKIDYYNALNEENMPVVLELGNIINSYFVSFINKIFDAKFLTELDISTNPSRIIENFDFEDVYIKKISVLLFRSEFQIQVEKIKGEIFLLFEEENADKFLDMLIKKLKIV
ncbi:MAG: hypothetical protein QXD43_02025 [Candidatus Aenigmatarchaeota archaeon]